MTLIVVACGRRKVDHPAPAARLYVGGYFREARSWALSVADGNTLRILSAKHGLVAFDQVLEPYDIKMGDPGSITSTVLAAQVADQGLDTTDEVIVVGGKLYVTLARTVWPNVRAPFGSETGRDMRFGYAMAEMQKMRGRIP